MPAKQLLFTAVFVELDGEYVAFIEELPAMNSRGRTIGEARSALIRLANEVFAEERLSADAAFVGRDILREAFAISMP